ncbi:MAG: hypothetical protein ACLQQB_07520 [Solirubrobacteraceae bacterium]
MTALLTTCALVGVTPTIGGALTNAYAATFGKTNVGESTDVFLADRKRVNKYALSSRGEVTKLSVYLEPTSTLGE